MSTAGEGEGSGQPLLMRLFWFGVGGFISVALNFGPFEWLTRHGGLPTWAALAISLTFVTALFSVWNYYLNFRTPLGWRNCLPRYLAALALCWLLSYLLMLVGLRAFGDERIGRFAVFFVVQSAVSVVKFALYHRWVYPREMVTA